MLWRRQSAPAQPTDIYTELGSEHPTVNKVIPSLRCKHCNFVGDARWIRVCSECDIQYCRDWCTNRHWKRHRPDTSQADIDKDIEARKALRWTETTVDERDCYDSELGGKIRVKCILHALEGYPQHLEYRIWWVNDSSPRSSTYDRKVAVDSLQDRPHCAKCRPRKRIAFRFNVVAGAGSEWDKPSWRDWKRLLFGRPFDKFEWYLEDRTGLPKRERVIERLYLEELKKAWITSEGDDTVLRLRVLRLRMRRWLRRLFYLSVLAQGALGALATSFGTPPWLIAIPVPFEIGFLALLEDQRLNTDHEHFTEYDKRLPERYR